MVEIYQLKDRDCQMNWRGKKKGPNCILLRNVHSKYKDTGDLK